MDAQNDNIPPPRTGMRRLIVPWEYRHLRAFGVTRVAGGSIAAAAGVVCSRTASTAGRPVPGDRGTESRRRLLVPHDRSLRARSGLIQPGTSLARDDRGQVAQRAVEMTRSKRRVRDHSDILHRGTGNMDDLPRSFVIRESSHRIHNPFTSEKLAALGDALQLPPGTSALDLACGSGEMLCTWARDHGLTGTGVDISSAFIGAARARAAELDVADRVTFLHGDAAGYIADQPAASLPASGATWIGGGVAGTVDLLRHSLGPGA